MSIKGARKQKQASKAEGANKWSLEWWNLVFDLIRKVLGTILMLLIVIIVMLVIMGILPPSSLKHVLQFKGLL